MVMKNGKLLWLSILMVGFIAFTASADVVINELYYDHVGGDTDHEFIELYNNGGSDVDLTGWQIQWGGTDYTYGTYDFPFGTTIYAGDYLLVGGALTASDFGVTPDLINAFNCQNAGSATDAVRLFNLTDYHDTCPYDWPNTNNLEGDPYGSGAADSLQCTVDVASGYSLSRVTVGVDNNLATDWEDLDTPTPTASSYTLVVSDIGDIRVNDANGEPLYVDSLVTITGIITCAEELGSSGPAYMYDNTGAIAVYDGTVTTSGVAIGDSVIVTGWVGFYAGLTEIVDEPTSGTPDVAFQIVSTGNDVTPIETVITDIDEDMEAYLVRINGCTFVETGLFTASTVHHAYVGTDTIAIYIDSSTDIPGEPIPIGECDIVGQVGQYDNTSPYFDGYQVIPRTIADIITGGVAGPTIDDTEPIPYLPDDMESVVINTMIYDDIAVSSAYVYYDAGADDWVALEIFDDGLHNDGAAGDSIYGNTIPGQTAGTGVNFYIEATDNEANTTYDPPDAPTSYYFYEHHDYSNVTAIATVREADTTGYPINIDGLYTVEGYVSAADEFGYAGPAHIQSDPDGGDGIAVYDNEVENYGWAIGDYVKVTGWVAFYNGLTQIVDAPYNSSYNPIVEINASGFDITPTVIGDLDDIGEDDESLLVELRGVRFTETGTFAASTNYWVTDGADSAQVRIDYDTNIPGTTIPEDPVTVIGAMGQYDYSSPYFSGYQILPRFDTDIYTPPLYITVIPTGPPVVIPVGGGSFEYNVDLYNNTATAQNIDINLIAELPNGNYYYFTPTPINVTLPAGLHANRLKDRNIPGGAPEGIYSYRITMEDRITGEVLTSDGMPFEKTATDGGGEYVDNWDGHWLTDWMWEEINPELDAGMGMLPEEYALDQNYPNPFNPATNISYSLPQSSYTQLQIYNLRGQLVATVVDGFRNAGYHEVTFDASGLASGLYIYHLQAGDFVDSGKMMLMK
ncbi:hypothetical protein CEE37_01820 [candidate division LCP-89 bacterium B3_LCP]|uniref:LTD domain-containing protein n=1 Tax=candidate division LCP-89 bacterium B3_LCP TaxID=2012998 RepID=A0A532V5G2_UNCL8|nr:MAG: hypothetical protein CEE37_01820 [candidate division LCP-89 bacterium B3_LCP]